MKSLIKFCITCSLLSVTFILPAAAQVYDEMFDPSCRLLLGNDTLTIGGDLPSWVFIAESPENGERNKSIKEKHSTKLNIRGFDNGVIIQNIEIDGDAGFGLTDINIDGYLDLRIEGNPFNLNPDFEFWIFSPQKLLFEKNEDFSGLEDYSIDQKNKQIVSSSHSTGGRGGETTVYKVFEDSLQAVQYTYSDRYDYKLLKLVNGEWKVTEEHVFDDESNALSTLSKYRLLGDSLCLFERMWLKPVKEEPSHLQLNNEVADCVLSLGCYIFVKKEEYEYKLTGGSPRLTGTRRSEVENDKWQSH